MSTVDLLGRVLDPFTECLTPQAARKVVDFRADEQTQARIDELADKCNEGQLNQQERREYDRFVTAIDFITVLQAKPRTVLERNPHG